MSEFKVGAKVRIKSLDHPEGVGIVANMRKAFNDFPNAEYIITSQGTTASTRWKFFIDSREYVFNEEDLEVVEDEESVATDSRFFTKLAEEKDLRSSEENTYYVLGIKIKFNGRENIDIGNTFVLSEDSVHDFCIAVLAAYEDMKAAKGEEHD